MNASCQNGYERLEQISSDVKGAIFFLTPDPIRETTLTQIQWVWDRLGRQRCLFLGYGSNEFEITSDFPNVELHRFVGEPEDCYEIVQEFLDSRSLSN